MMTKTRVLSLQSTETRIACFFTLLLTGVVICALSSQSALAGPYYKWTDEKGVTHFTDKPPKGKEAEKVIKAKRIPKTHAEAAAEKEAAAEAEALAERRKNCEAAKKRVHTLKTNAQIQMRTTDGGVRTLSKEEVQQEIEQSELAVKQACEGL